MNSQLETIKEKLSRRWFCLTLPSGHYGKPWDNRYVFSGISEINGDIHLNLDGGYGFIFKGPLFVDIIKEDSTGSCEMELYGYDEMIFVVDGRPSRRYHEGGVVTFYV